MKGYDLKNVKKELPPRETRDGILYWCDDVLACVKGITTEGEERKYFAVATYDFDDEEWDYNSQLQSEQVTHWSKLPEFP